MMDDLVWRLHVNSSWFSSPGKLTDTFICHWLLQVCATPLGQKSFAIVTTGFIFQIVTLQHGCKLPLYQGVTDEGVT